MRHLAAGLAGALLLAGCTTPSASTGAGASSAGVRASSRHTVPGTRSGTVAALPRCPLDSLPAQAAEVAQKIVDGGPFAYPRNDGVTYFNRNGVLPSRARGVYREFTVTTPGARTRGTRRLITDGNPASGTPTRTPSAWYYTGDHYETFCAVSGTP